MIFVTKFKSCLSAPTVWLVLNASGEPISVCLSPLIWANDLGQSRFCISCQKNDSRLKIRYYSYSRLVIIYLGDGWLFNPRRISVASLVLSVALVSAMNDLFIDLWLSFDVLFGHRYCAWWELQHSQLLALANKSCGIMWLSGICHCMWQEMIQPAKPVSVYCPR